MLLESEEYPFVSLSETTNSSPSGQILSKSVLITLRNKSPKQVWGAYQELKKLTGDKEGNLENETKNNLVKKEAEVCLKCGGLMVEKRGISKKTGKPYAFKSCANWPACNYTQPLISEENEPSHEDLRTVFV